MIYNNFKLSGMLLHVTVLLILPELLSLEILEWPALCLIKITTSLVVKVIMTLKGSIGYLISDQSY